MNINLTLIGQTIAFAVFVWFCMKYVWPPIMAALEERKKKIADGLAAAEQGAQAQEKAEAEAADLIKDAKQQASDIISQAQKRGSEMVEEAKGTAKTEAERVKTAAQAELEQEISRARENLRGQVAILAVAGAEKILQREIDAKAHQQVVDELAAQI